MRQRFLAPMGLLTIALVAVVIGAAPASTQSPPQDDARPIPRRHHAIAYDTRSERVVLSGGASVTNEFIDDLWSWDGIRWTLVARPGMTAGHSMYSDQHGNLMLVGGTRNETSVFNGETWMRIVEEPRACCMGMAFDTERNRLVMHGGSLRPGEVTGDTLEFDGTTWQRRAVRGPSPRMSSSVTFDAARGVVVLIGGMALNPTRWLDDLWEWDGVMWRQPVIEGDRPAPRNSAGIAYDQARREVVLFGGLDENRNELGDTWLFNGSRWRRADVEGPSPRYEGFLAYDARREVVVLFGGDTNVDGSLNDTWEWDGLRWTDVTSPAAALRARPLRPR